MVAKKLIVKARELKPREKIRDIAERSRGFMKEKYQKARNAIIEADKPTMAIGAGLTLLPVVGPVAKVVLGSMALTKDVRPEECKSIKHYTLKSMLNVGRAITGAIVATMAPPVISVPVIMTGAVKLGLSAKELKEFYAMKEAAAQEA